MITRALSRRGKGLELRLDPSLSPADIPLHLALRVPATVLTLAVLLANVGLDAALRSAAGYESSGLVQVVQYASIVYPMCLVVWAALDNLKARAMKQDEVTVADGRSYDLLAAPVALGLGVALTWWL